MTVPNSVIIPYCGDLSSVISNQSVTVDYCNYTNGVNEPLDTGATTLYNLTPSEPSHHENIISCIHGEQQECYMLNVFCKEHIIEYPCSSCNLNPLKVKVTVGIMQCENI